jgi:uncharacterized flavoprotein (TIGR03862 family)
VRREQGLSVAIIGGGPAGLIAAETLSAQGCRVTVYDRMPTFGRKLLMAGRGGLNLTHAEPFERFRTRYGEAAERLRPYLDAFPPQTLIDWAEGLGVVTFTGSSGRVFPKALKASPLLRAWLTRLSEQGVRLEPRAQWLGWDETGALIFRGRPAERPDAVILALGGASWPKLGSTGDWAEILQAAGIEIAPFRPANCGFVVGWSDPFRARFAGTPLKSLALSFEGRRVRGEAVITGYGLEGGGIYALSAALRDAIARDGQAVLELDLRPDLAEDQLARKLSRPRGGQSLSNFLRKTAGLPPVAVSLLREAGVGAGSENLAPENLAPKNLAHAIKHVPVVLAATAGLERAISSAGGIAWPEVGQDLMLKRLPGVFVAGEMLDWEAPTGGYLLQACFATGVAAAKGVLARLAGRA